MRPVNRTGWMQRHQDVIDANDGPFWPLVDTLLEVAQRHRDESEFAAELAAALNDMAVTYNKNRIVGASGPLGDGQA